jgi:alpha-beta hydrolase superfamily lysophospholipase
MPSSRIVSTCLAVAVLYVAFIAGILRFGIDRLAIPASASAYVTPDALTRVAGSSGNEVLIRRYGKPDLGCVVFFPGQHGNAPRYDLRLFRTFTAEGIAVFALSYPGQDGAHGRASLAEVARLSRRAIEPVVAQCQPQRTVFDGRSLGAMLAAYASRNLPIAGVILEGAAPSLHDAVERQMRAHWYTAPLAKLAASGILPHDYSLAEALASEPKTPVILLQGTKDDETPIEALQTDGTLPRNARLIPVPGGTHSNAYLIEPQAHARLARSMISVAAARSDGIVERK